MLNNHSNKLNQYTKYTRDRVHNDILYDQFRDGTSQFLYAWNFASFIQVNEHNLTMSFENAGFSNFNRIHVSSTRYFLSINRQSPFHERGTFHWPSCCVKTATRENELANWLDRIRCIDYNTLIRALVLNNI